MISVGIVADANVLLSAAVGKAALRVFSEYKVPVHTTRFNAEEVMEYLPRLSSKYEIPLALARALSLPIWSNDSDLSNVGVDFYTTARLLKILSAAP